MHKIMRVMEDQIIVLLLMMVIMEVIIEYTIMDLQVKANIEDLGTIITMANQIFFDYRSSSHLSQPYSTNANSQPPLYPHSSPLEA